MRDSSCSRLHHQGAYRRHSPLRTNYKDVSIPGTILLSSTGPLSYNILGEHIMIHLCSSRFNHQGVYRRRYPPRTNYKDISNYKDVSIPRTIHLSSTGQLSYNILGEHTMIHSCSSRSHHQGVCRRRYPPRTNYKDISNYEDVSIPRTIHLSSTGPLPYNILGEHTMIHLCSSRRRYPPRTNYKDISVPRRIQVSNTGT